VKKDDQPVAIGMELSAKALESISDMPDQMFFLTMPEQAASTSYKTLTIDWNKMGHEPKVVYTFPHFDFHFYMILKEQTISIVGGLDEGAYALTLKIYCQLTIPLVLLLWPCHTWATLGRHYFSGIHTGRFHQNIRIWLPSG